jgi:hypothetical protein
MTIENARPNFYILLDMRPDEKWDQTKFEQVLRTKQIEWSRQGSGVAKKALAAKKYLALLPEIRRVMLDTALREAEAKAAHAELASGHKADLERFERELSYLNAKEYVEQSELDAFVNEFRKVLADKEIVARVKVPVRKVAPAGTQATAPQLDASIAKTIEDNLALLGVANLYDLLGRPATTANAELYKAAEQLYNDMVSRQPKTAEVTAQSDLAGHARTIFKTAESRTRYDETLRQRSLNTLLKDLEKSVNRTTTKEVHEKQVRTFLLEARKAGWPEEVARARLKEYALAHKWMLQLPGTDTRPAGLRCGNCHEINEAGRNFCHQCNEELMTTCPDCNNKVATDDAGCGNCGFPVGNRYWVDTLLKRIATSLGSQQAQDWQSEAEELWKPKRPDARAQKIREYKGVLQQRSEEQRRTADQLRQIMKERHFYAARDFLATHVNDSVEWKTAQQTVEQKIAEAQQFLKQAQVRTLSQSQRMDLCRQALHACADYEDAYNLLRTMPPEAPHNLQARLGNAIVSLSWDLSPTTGVNYQVIRKAYTQPVSSKDGSQLATISGRAYDDIAPEIGLPLYYAIFAECEGVQSTQSAVLREPVLLMKDIEQETVEINHQQIELAWKVPPHVEHVIVVRKEQSAPASIHDGQRLPLVHPTHLVDRDVQNDHTYYYAIYCQFKNHLGTILTTPGKIIQAIPETPPAPITRIEITHSKTPQGYRVQLNWTKPLKGRVVVLKSAQPVQLKAGGIVQAALLKDYGQVLEGQPDSLVDPWSHPGIGYYIPTVLFGGMAYIGETCRYACIDDVSDLRYENLGTALRLEWVWPQRCQEVIVSYNSTKWPQTNDALAVSRRVTRAAYESQGHFDIKETPDHDYYIVVAAVVQQGNEQISGVGARVHARLATKVALTYEIKQAGFLGRHKRMLHIHARQSGVLPTLLLVKSQGRLPLQRSEGEMFYRLEGPTPIQKELAIELPNTNLPQRTFGKLYLEDDTEYEGVIIHHPSMDKLRLG